MAKRRSQPIRRRRFSRSNILSSLSSLFLGVLSNPTFIIIVAFGFWVHSTPEIIDKVVATLKKSPLLAPLATFIESHTKQTIGYIPLVAASFVSSRRNFVLGSLLLTGILVYLILPASTSYYEYLILSIFTGTFARARSSYLKASVLFLAVVTIGIGWWGAGLFQSTNTASG